MSITRRCDYACRIIRAAYKSGESCISIAEVAEQEQIPYSFARSIQHELMKAGFLKTTRGVRGGLTLACDPKETTVYDILRALKGSVSVAECTEDCYQCAHKKGCSFRSVWQAADALVSRLYRSITLDDLFDQGAQHPAIKEALKQCKQ